MPEQPLIIRAATARDLDALRPRLSGLALLAEHHGRAVAAIALTSGRIASASPPPAEAVHGLRRTRYRLLRQGGDVGPAASLLRRLAP